MQVVQKPWNSGLAGIGMRPALASSFENENLQPGLS
jgi:hypothetical protein